MGAINDWKISQEKGEEKAEATAIYLRARNDGAVPCRDVPKPGSEGLSARQSGSGKEEGARNAASNGIGLTSLCPSIKDAASRWWEEKEQVVVREEEDDEQEEE